MHRPALGLLFTLLLTGGAYAQANHQPLGGPQATPRVPEAATDVPVKAPGAVTTGTTTSGAPSTDVPTPNTDRNTPAGQVLTNPPTSSTQNGK